MLCLYNFLEKRGGLEYLNTYKGEKGKRSKEAKRDDRPPTVTPTNRNRFTSIASFHASIASSVVYNQSRWTPVEDMPTAGGLVLRDLLQAEVIRNFGGRGYQTSDTMIITSVSHSPERHVAAAVAPNSSLFATR